ncbi:conserved Plasmodium membrane protein, unknown function [Plasmodium gallinaceum]|uniref:Uncharacterized protein n=1 Tax=Plasmodium gallinaceum TaxID=5849 RepID=A0A1J1GV00_PLAGA|nr:conserved Plasmodium membrane protein, unknown function [Plasmodium gallinaceum]CRG95128.1 conserved Plasmodium membrane protein, unknown function [Plasmodium gallinaceum]
MKMFFLIRRRLTCEVNNYENISNSFLIKFYLYNFSKINIDAYIKLITLLNNYENITESNNILNAPYFKNPNLVLYKYFQFFNEKNAKKKLLNLLMLLYSRNIREYQDQKNFFYNSSIYVHNFVFRKFFYFHSSFYFKIKENKETVNVINKYNLYTDFFLYSLDFYLFHLSKNCNILSIENLNILSNIYSNINITRGYEYHLHLDDNINGKFYKYDKVDKVTTYKDSNNNKYETFEDNTEKNIDTNNQISTAFDNNLSNKICLLYIYISKSIIYQTHTYILNKRKVFQKEISIKEIMLNNVNACKNILNKILNKSIKEQYIKYKILKKKHNDKLLNLNILKNYFNAVKFLNIINIKKYIYIIIYLYFNSILFNKSIYYSSLIFCLLQKYNLQYTYIYNILLIKFNLFFWNYKILNDFNKIIILDAINKYIDTILISQIKKKDKKENDINFLFPDDFYNDVYKKEYLENLKIYNMLYNKTYKYKKNSYHVLTYFEYSIFSLFKYLFYNIMCVEKNKNDKTKHFLENYIYKNKCFVSKKYNNFYLYLSDILLSNIILLSVYVQNCMPILFSLMQKASIVSTKKMKKNKSSLFYKRSILIMNEDDNKCNSLKRKNSLLLRILYKNAYNNYTYKKYVREKLKNVNPFLLFLFNVYKIFKLKIINNHNIEEKQQNKNKKYMEESYIFNNIKKNKNNKIQTSLTHYYISSNLKKLNDSNLFNEKNILTFYCDISFNNNIIEVDGPKHFFIYYSFPNNSENYFNPFILKNKDIFDYYYVFPFFFNKTGVLSIKDKNNNYYLYNDKSIKKNFFLYIYGYIIKHINYNDDNITDYKYLYNIIFKKKCQLYLI